MPDLSGSVAGIVQGAAKCERCGAANLLGNGCCVSCLLKENFEAEVEESAEVFESVLGQADVPDKEWRLGNYQILEEIGRGGMGVIYRARQRHSGRIVALKRVLTYHADSHETLERFRREAEAAASLDHPNILPVYEVSETEDGLPFFSMKFATGGSLRNAASGLRSETRECVRLMAKIARAIEYAHSQGVGPAADIYSLGAILFNLLAGRPPFIGANALSVIQQAAATSAPKLRSFVPSLNRDLETIVARCLERDPKARYQTAGVLAEDLERWLEGRPIIARPVRAPARVFRWSRRNPILASAVAACLLLGLVVGWLLGEKFLAPKAPAPEKSIAVLPFENLSGNKQNSYFADGVQDEILTDLAKIADLKVISRSSVMHYKSGVERNLRKIGEELGVARVLEGSVQRSGNRVRVNAQLIDARNDAHLWAQTYDRDVADVFAIQSEIAKAIADQLRVRLSGREEQVIASKPTDNVEAYDAYLRGLAYSLKTVNTTANALGAQKYFKDAVRLDPKFALGWAMLSYVDAAGYRSLALQPTVALREEARQAAETALTLQPNLGEAILAKGYYHYSCLKDYDTALRYFEQARQLLPNSSRILEALAFLERRRGHWDRSESYFNEAERLDPRNASLLGQHAVTYLHQRRFPEALRKYDQVLNITPDDVAILAEKASVAQAEGDLPRAAALLAPLHPNADDGAALATQAYQAILERRPAQIIPRLKEILAKPDPVLGYNNGELRFWLGWAQEVAGDHAAAQESWRQARSELQSFLNEQPENSLLMDDLALTNMGLGDKAAAFKLIEQAIAANPIEKDALLGPKSIEVLARVAAQMGEPDRAIAALQKLLSIPCASALTVPVPLTPAVLRLDPMFDPLRNDPRFQKLAASLAPKAN